LPQKAVAIFTLSTYNRKLLNISVDNYVTMSCPKRAFGHRGNLSFLILFLYTVVLFFNPYSSTGLTSGSYTVIGLMYGLAPLALGSSWRLKPILLPIVLFGSFAPVGFYFLLMPGIFGRIGVVNGLYLVAAIWTESNRTRLNAHVDQALAIRKKWQKYCIELNN